MNRSTKGTLQTFNAQLQRAAMESELRQRSSVTLAFRTLAMQQPREHYAQSSMFAEPRCQDTRDEWVCPHDFAFEQQRRFEDNGYDVICTGCGEVMPGGVADVDR
jgi:hypothetical protein